MAHRAVPTVLIAALVPALPAAAEPVRAVYSLEAGAGLATDGRAGASVGGRLGGELVLGERVSLGAGGDVGVAQWWAVGDDAPEDLVGTQVFGQLHVGIQLGPQLRLEPAIGGGAMNLGGNRINGWLPAYSATVAIVYGQLRAGIRSRVAVGDLEIAGEMTFRYDPGAELHAFIGWQH